MTFYCLKIEESENDAEEDALFNRMETDGYFYC